MYRERNFSGASQVFKSVLVSVVSCFVLTFLYALILRIFSLGDGGIRIVNSVIKVLSVFLGVFLFIRDEKGLLKGAISGGISLLLTSFAVSLAVGHFSVLFFLELLFGIIVGGISGVIAVNAKRR